MKLSELADKTGGRISGSPDVEITGVAGTGDARKGDITYLINKKHLSDVLSSDVSAVIVNESIHEIITREGPITASLLIADNPQYIFAKALEIFYVKQPAHTGISEKAVISENAAVGTDVTIHPTAFISSNVKVGDRTTISPGVFIGENVSIGSDTFIHPNVTIRENVVIGNNVIIHSGTVIGSDGFGYVFENGSHYKIPQVGGVVIEDDVEIGANTAIDRATLGNTIIGCGTKIDNLVQVAHNVKIGKKCIIAGQVGISGSVEVGDGVVLAGQVGIRDHLKIGSRAIVSAQTGVVSDIPEGEIYSGTPAIPHKVWLRVQSIYSKLPELIKRLKEIEKKQEDQ